MTKRKTRRYVPPKALKGQIRRAKALGYTFDALGRARKGKKLVKIASVQRALARKPARKPARRPVRITTREKRQQAEIARLRRQLAEAKKRKRPKPKPKKPKPVPVKKKKRRMTPEEVQDLRERYDSLSANIAYGGASEPSWGWGRRPPNPENKYDAGSDALAVKNLITNKAEQERAMTMVREETRAPKKAKSYSLSFTLVTRLGDEFGIDGTNRTTIGPAGEELVLIFDKLRGEYPTPEAAYAALDKALSEARTRGQAMFYLERIILHAHK